MKKINWLTLLFVLLIAGSLPAISFAGDDVLAPFVTAQTEAVIHVDLSRIDMDAVFAWWQTSFDNSKLDKAMIAQEKKEATAQLATAKDWLAKFKKAGGKDIYGVITFHDLFEGPGPVAVLPLGEGADSDALAKLIISDDDDATSAVIGKTLVIGTKEAMEKLKAGKSVARPDLTEPLSINPDAQVHAVVSVTALNTLLGVQGPDSFLNNFKATKWALLAITAPPKGLLAATIQCNDANAATALAALINAQIDKMKTDPYSKRTFGDHLDKLAAALKPKIDGVKVSLSLDQDLIGAIFPDVGANGIFGMPVAVSPNDGDTSRPATAPPAPDNGPGGL